MQVSRRNFLKAGVIASLAGTVSAGSLSACTISEKKDRNGKNISKKTSDGRSVGSKGHGKYNIIDANNLDNAQKKSVEPYDLPGQKVPVIETYMPFMGYKTYIRIVGEGRSDMAPIILIHGGPGSSHNYFETLDNLAVNGRQVISYDQIGCGNSYVEDHTEWWNKDTWINELNEVQKYLNLNELHILGQSWGGMLVIAYCIEQKPTNICSAIISSGHYSSSLWAKEQHRLIRYMDQVDQNEIAEAEKLNDFKRNGYIDANNRYYEKFVRPTYTESDPECLRRKPVPGKTEVYQAGWGPNEYNPTGSLKDFEYEDKLAEISQSTLIFNGSNDICTPYIAKTMYDKISDSKWALMRDARHNCWYEAHQDYCLILNDWLEQHE